MSEYVSESEKCRAEKVLDELLQVDGGLSSSNIDFLESMNSKRNYPWTSKQLMTQIE